MTDISDVVVVNNPFEHPFFIENPGTIFCGDEPKVLENDWMIDHSAHFRQKIADYSNYENKFANETLLNCGIICGSIYMVKDFIQNLCAIHKQFNMDNRTLFTGDMGAFNYLARTKLIINSNMALRLIRYLKDMNWTEGIVGLGINKNKNSLKRRVWTV